MTELDLPYGTHVTRDTVPCESTIADAYRACMCEAGFHDVARAVITATIEEVEGYWRGVPVVKDQWVYVVFSALSFLLETPRGHYEWSVVDRKAKTLILARHNQLLEAHS